MRKLIALVVPLVVLVGMSLPAAAEEEEAPKWNVETYLKEAHALGDITVSAGPDFATLDWIGIELGDEASRDARELADGALSGEHDGNVDEKELDDFLFALTALFESTFGKYANHHAFSGFVLIDQAEAQKVEVLSVDADGLDGPVDQEGHVTVGMSLKVSFPNVDDHKDVHTVRFDLGPNYISEDAEGSAKKFAGDLTLTIQGADGWKLDTSSVQPACAAENAQGNRLVFQAEDADCFAGSSGVVLSFAITGKGKRDNFLPGAEVGAILASIGAAIGLRRRF